MGIFYELIMALAQLVSLVFNIYTFIVIGRALVSWVSPDPYNPIVRFLYQATEPVLARLRRWLPVSFGGIDFSPAILLIGLIFVERILVRLLQQLATAL